MARIIGGVAASHTPTIGFAYDQHKQDDPSWAPILSTQASVGWNGKSGNWSSNRATTFSNTMPARCPRGWDGP